MWDAGLPPPLPTPRPHLSPSLPSPLPPSQSAYLSTLEALQKTMTGATLKHLSPANALPLWTVQVAAKPDVPLSG